MTDRDILVSAPDPACYPCLQQCGRFHLLDRFAPGLHSCREQLARHAERRRRTRALAAARKAGPRGRAAPARPTDDQAANPCGTTAAAALHAKRPHSALADPTAAAPSDQHASPVRSPGCQDAPPRLQGGLSGSSESTHSIHFAQGAEAEETAGHRTAAGSPSFSCDGMDALLAAAAEQEEAEAEGPAAKRPRPIASLHPTASALVLPLQRSVALSLEPDPTWFAALAERTAARTVSQPAAGIGQVSSLMQPSMQPSAVLPMPAHILSALPLEASAVLPPAPAQAPPAWPEQPPSLLAPGCPTAPLGAAPAAPALSSLLHLLLAAEAQRQALCQQPAALLRLAPTLAGVTLAQATAALRLVAVQQAQQLHEAHRAAQAHRELLAAREREQQELQHAQHVAGLFKAIAEGLAALCAGAATPGQPLTR